MPRESWKEVLLPAGNAEQVWELFHENSKTNRYQTLPSSQSVIARMKAMDESLTFEGHPCFCLPSALPPLECSLEQAILARSSPVALKPSRLSLDRLASLFRHSYGITRVNDGTNFPRPFRSVPSAGALYPLELFFYTSAVEQLPVGIFHYNPTSNTIRLLQDGDATQAIAHALVQSEIVTGSSVMIFITSVFERTIFKYGDRGYRFILLEAGHVAQNMNLVATALGLGCMNLGGFFDRKIDDVLGLDGVTHSTIYILAIGQHDNSERS